MLGHPSSPHVPTTQPHHLHKHCASKRPQTRGKMHLTPSPAQLFVQVCGPTRRVPMYRRPSHITCTNCVQVNARKLEANAPRALTCTTVSAGAPGLPSNPQVPTTQPHHLHDVCADESSNTQENITCTISHPHLHNLLCRWSRRDTRTAPTRVFRHR